MKELDHESGRLLAQLLEGAQMPEKRGAAIWSDIEQSIARDAAPRIGDGGPLEPPRRSGRYPALAAAAGVLLAAGLLTGVIASRGARYQPNGDDVQAAQVATEPASPHETVTVKTPTPTVHDDHRIEEVETPAEEVAVGQPPKRRRPTQADPREELALLLEARNAVNAKRYDEASKWLRKHARAYPKGAFAQERRLLEVKALCGSGKLKEARRIVERDGGSTPGLRQACPALQ